MLNDYIGIRLSPTEKKAVLELAGSKRKVSATIRRLIRDQVKREGIEIQLDIQQANSQAVPETQKFLI